jgi:hypothetical protein
MAFFNGFRCGCKYLSVFLRGNDRELQAGPQIRILWCRSRDGNPGFCEILESGILVPSPNLHFYEFVGKINEIFQNKRFFTYILLKLCLIYAKNGLISKRLDQFRLKSGFWVQRGFNTGIESERKTAGIPGIHSTTCNRKLAHKPWKGKSRTLFLNLMSVPVKWCVNLFYPFSFTMKWSNKNGIEALLGRKMSGRRERESSRLGGRVLG